MHTRTYTTTTKKKKGERRSQLTTAQSLILKHAHTLSRHHVSTVLLSANTAHPFLHKPHNRAILRTLIQTLYTYISDINVCAIL